MSNKNDVAELAVMLSNALVDCTRVDLIEALQTIESMQEAESIASVAAGAGYTDTCKALESVERALEARLFRL